MGERKMKISIDAKCSDCCVVRVEDANGNELYDKDGYVPEFLSIGEWGDYLRLTIDNDTGKILNWKPIKKEDLQGEDNE
jgi:hypothetical protein